MGDVIAKSADTSRPASTPIDGEVACDIYECECGLHYVSEQDVRTCSCHRERKKQDGAKA